MKPTAEPDPEVVAATDAVFEEGSPAGAEPERPAAPAPPAPQRGEEEEAPLHDYVRELGEEYQQQQDDGKL